MLGIRWIERGVGFVPTEFQKRAGSELDGGPRIEPLSRFLELEIYRHESGLALEPVAAPPPQQLDPVFLAALEEVWGGR